MMLVTAFLWDETGRVRCCFFCGIELSPPAKREPYSLSCRVVWAYGSRVPSKEMHDMNTKLHPLIDADLRTHSWCHPRTDRPSSTCYPFRIVTLTVLTLSPLEETILDTAPLSQPFSNPPLRLPSPLALAFPPSLTPELLPSLPRSALHCALAHTGRCD